MLAMMIVALLVPVLYNTMHMGFSAKARAEAAVEPPRTAELVMDMVRNDLGGAMPPTGTLANAFIGTNAVGNGGGEADDLIFFSTADAPQDGTPLVNGEIKQVELTVMTAPDGQQVLVRKVTRDVIGLLSGEIATPDVEVICRGVTGFQLRYFDGNNWGEAWNSTETNFNNDLPAAVQVTITFNRPNGANGELRSFRYTRLIPISCSYAPYDPALETGFTESQ